MVKRCCYGTCKSDTRYPERLIEGVRFIPFPKPLKDLEKCKKWIRLCGRPHEQLNLNILQDRSKAKHLYVCTKHFAEGEPTSQYPDPEPASSYEKVTPARRPPKPRPCSEPPRKKARVVLAECYRSNQEVTNGNSAASLPNESECVPTDTPLQSDISAAAQDSNNENLPLEMLALAAENESLKKQLASLILKNVELERRAARVEISSQKNVDTKTNIISVNKLRENKKKDEFVYYTGLTSEQFSSLYAFLVPEENPFRMSKKIGSIGNLAMEDQLLLILMKLRQNFDFVHLGKLFGLSQQDTSTLFKNWIQYMFYRCGSISIWPHRDVIISQMPDNYRSEFPDTLVIIDGTELKIQRPSSMTRQSQCYSDYKSCNTLKGLVGIDPRGSIIFASMLFAGSISDKEITLQSGFLRVLEELKRCGKINEGDGVMVDKGFHISEEIEKLGLRLNIPPFARSGSQMSEAEIKLTEKIARHRVHVERAIARVKNFKILSHRIDLSLFTCIDQIWFVCCFVTNFMGFLIK